MVYSVCLRTGLRLPYSSAKLVAIGRGYFQESVQVSIFFRRGSMYADVYGGTRSRDRLGTSKYGLRSTRLAFTRIYPREINRNIVWSPHNESEYPILRCHGLAMRNGPRRPPHLPNLLQFSHIEIRISGAALAPKDICCTIHTKMN